MAAGMVTISIVQPNGTVHGSQKYCGTADEHQYFKVITERWGKLFFESRGKYRQWCRNGSQRNEDSGRFFPSRNRGMEKLSSEEEEKKEHEYIEEYTVADYEGGVSETAEVAEELIGVVEEVA